MRRADQNHTDQWPGIAITLLVHIGQPQVQHTQHQRHQPPGPVEAEIGKQVITQRQHQQWHRAAQPGPEGRIQHPHPQQPERTAAIQQCQPQEAHTQLRLPGGIRADQNQFVSNRRQHRHNGRQHNQQQRQRRQRIQLRTTAGRQQHQYRQCQQGEIIRGDHAFTGEGNPLRQQHQQYARQSRPVRIGTPALHPLPPAVCAGRLIIVLITVLQQPVKTWYRKEHIGQRQQIE